MIHLRSLRARRLARDDGGQAMAEMALVIPALLLLIFGIIEFGNAWRAYQVITNAAREGVRRAVMANGGLVDSSDAAVLGIVQDVMTDGGLTYSASYVTLSCGDTAGGTCAGMRGTPETVRIEYPHQFLFFGPILSTFCTSCGTGGTITLSSEAVMRSEG
jgi:hypothetical protein